MLDDVSWLRRELEGARREAKWWEDKWREELRAHTDTQIALAEARQNARVLP